MARTSIAIFAALAALVATAASAFEDVDGSLARLAPDDRRFLIEVIDLHVIDGTSSRLRGVKPVAEKTYFCGLVNAKNSFGAYVGFRRFLVHIDTRKFYVDGDFQRGTEHLAASNKRLIGSMCG